MCLAGTACLQSIDSDKPSLAPAWNLKIQLRPTQRLRSTRWVDLVGNMWPLSGLCQDPLQARGVVLCLHQPIQDRQ